MVHTDSATAMDMITAQRPDVVLCDVCMPVSGMQILRQVVADPVLVHIPMIMMTVSDDETLRAEALELGATDLLAKPLRKTDLLPRVRNALLVRSHISYLQSYSHELERQVRRRTAELLGSRHRTHSLFGPIGRIPRQRNRPTCHPSREVFRFVGPCTRYR